MKPGMQNRHNISDDDHNDVKYSQARKRMKDETVLDYEVLKDRGKLIPRKGIGDKTREAEKKPRAGRQADK